MRLRRGGCQTLQWNFDAASFMLPQHQLGMIAGIVALLLMIPAAVTSCDRLQDYLGKLWRRIHLLTVPAFLLCAIHAALIGSHYLGGFEWKLHHQLLTAVLGVVMVLVLFVRSRLIWSILSLDNFYVSPIKQK